MRENSLRLYKIDINYIKYLYSFDNRVQFNPNNDDEYSAKRPYLGVILEINNFEYFVPLEHPRLAHQKMKNNIFLFKIHSGKYGILGFNNMIPVNKEQLVDFDINEKSEKYKQVLISQYHFCNKHIEEIRKKAMATYCKRGCNNFLKNICCDFKLLEEKAKLFQKM